MDNPYAPPGSNLDIGEADKHPDALATKKDRFFAAIIDGIIMLVIAVPAMYLLGLYEYAAKGETAPFLTVAVGAVFGFLTYTLVNGYLLSKYGQTVGKRLLNIKIVNMEGAQLPLTRILLLRVLPIQLLGFIPTFGNLLALIEVLFVFRQDRRCIHDLIAGTQVVNAVKR